MSQAIMDCITMGNFTAAIELARDPAHPIDWVITDGRRRFLFHRVVAHPALEALSVVLVERGADLEALDEAGWTPLMCASAGCAASAAFLISKGARIDVRSPGKATPLAIAATYNKARTIELLLAVGADLECRDDEGMTPLLKSVAQHATNAFRALVAAGANLDARTSDGREMEDLAFGQMKPMIRAARAERQMAGIDAPGGSCAPRKPGL